ncbi:MAG: hypothetical protein U0625_08115 [Phycisphaerales bacterium]
MLRFAVFDEHGPARDLRLVNAHLLGSDDAPMEGAVSFRDGHIECAPADTASSHALCLEVDAGRAGALMLPTCLLQQREEPYRFYEELARHRIKLFLEKSENWGLLDPAKAPEAFELFERSRDRFVAGMVEAQPYRAEMAHRDSLALAVYASEKLAARRAEWMLHGRFGKAAATHALGVRAPVEKAPDLLKSTLSREFDIVAVPTPWSLIEPSPGRYVWEATDRWMAWSKQSGRRAIAGPLLDMSPNGMPGWVRPILSDPAKLKDRLYGFIREVVTRYGPINPIWNIASGVHLNEAATLTLEAMVQSTRLAGVAVRQVRRDAKLLVEVCDPFGDSVLSNRGAVSSMAYLRALLAEGVPFDLLGLPMLCGESGRGRGTRDLLQLAAMLDRFTARKEMPPVIVTALGAPSSATNELGEGWWREPWSARAQAAWASMAFQVALSNPGVAAAIWDRLRDDAGGGMRSGGLYAADGSPKPSADRLLATRRRLRVPLGAMPAAAPASASEPTAGVGADDSTIQMSASEMQEP